MAIWSEPEVQTYQVSEASTAPNSVTRAFESYQYTGSCQCGAQCVGHQAPTPPSTTVATTSVMIAEPTRIALWITSVSTTALSPPIAV
jgi:hypothetical protein